MPTVKQLNQVYDNVEKNCTFITLRFYCGNSA